VGGWTDGWVDLWIWLFSESNFSNVSVVESRQNKIIEVRVVYLLLWAGKCGRICGDLYALRGKRVSIQVL
jgi:hypothetical protein